MDLHPRDTRIAPGDGPVRERLMARLAEAPDARLAEAVGRLALAAHETVDALGATEAELAAAADWLAAVGQASDARRQEWILLADMLGLGAHLARRHGAPEASPSAPRGPFWREDAPAREAGADLRLDGRGAPLDVEVAVRGRAGPLAGARVETWQANAEGLYENQDPDGQPEMNLRGVFRTDAEGRARWRSTRPGPRRLPEDGPVRGLMDRMGWPALRPAGLHLCVGAPGHRTLTAEIFDAADPLLERDPILVACPTRACAFRSTGDGWTVRIEIALAPDPQGAGHDPD